MSRRDPASTVIRGSSCSAGSQAAAFRITAVARGRPGPGSHRQQDDLHGAPRATALNLPADGEDDEQGRIEAKSERGAHRPDGLVVVAPGRGDEHAENVAGQGTVGEQGLRTASADGADPQQNQVPGDDAGKRMSETLERRGVGRTGGDGENHQHVAHALSVVGRHPGRLCATARPENLRAPRTQSECAGP